MIRIEVVSTATKEVVKRATGEVFRIPETSGYAHGIDKYPVPIRFSVGRGKDPYAPGMYQLDPAASLYVGKFGELSIRSQLVLVPIAADSKPPKAG